MAHPGPPPKSATVHYIIYIFYIYGLYNPGLYNFRRHVYIFIDVLYYVFLYLRFFTVLVYTTLDTLCAFYRVSACVSRNSWDM